MLNGLSVDESVSELGGYSGIGTPTASPPASVEGTQSPAVSMVPVCNVDDDGILFPRIAHVQSANIKVELLDDNENPEEVCYELCHLLCTQEIKMFFSYMWAMQSRVLPQRGGEGIEY